MPETRKQAEGSYLTYCGKPLVREGNTICYGDMNRDPAYLLLEIMSNKKEVAGEKLPDKILIQIIDSKDPSKILKQGSKDSLSEAFSIGLIWLGIANGNG
ncbi:MAG: hypothetical protein IJR83_08340 [Clostridia bacterium]|nr:hypothetical protein [Clostridia bacterium]